jgi:cold shock CspA family protein
MQLPVQITFRNMDSSPAVEARIREEAAKLDEFYQRIMSCRVKVEMSRHHPQRGRVYNIRIDLTVPGGEIVVSHEPARRSTARRTAVERATKRLEVDGAYKDINVAIRDAFKAARRRLQDYARRQRAEVKTHEPPPHARVRSLFAAADYGFLETPEGVEIYFHRNSVLNEGFDRLEVGTEVSFVEEIGEKGPQASTVRIIERRREAAS